MIGPIAKALDQIGDRAFRAVLLKAVGLTVGVLVALYVLAGWLVAGLGPYDLPVIGVVDPGGWAAGIAVGALILASVFLMIPVASICIGFFLEDIAAAVEARHYPDLPGASPLSLSRALVDSLQFFGVLVIANLCALVIYLLVPPLAPVIFYVVNGYLLGREYFQLVALRRVPKSEARRLRRRHRGRIWVMGMAMAVPLSVPIVNLLVPLVGVAAYTHLYHDITG